MDILKIMRSVINDHKHLFLINLLGCLALIIGGLTIVKFVYICIFFTILESIIFSILLGSAIKLFFKNKYRLLPMTTWKIYVGNLLGTGFGLLLTSIMSFVSVIIIFIHNFGFDNIQQMYFQILSGLDFKIVDALLQLSMLFVLIVLFGVIQQNLEHLWNRLISIIVTFISFIVAIYLIGRVFLLAFNTKLGLEVQLLGEIVLIGLVIGGTIFFIDRYVETKVEAN